MLSISMAPISPCARIVFDSYAPATVNSSNLSNHFLVANLELFDFFYIFASNNSIRFELLDFLPKHISMPFLVALECVSFLK